MKLTIFFLGLVVANLAVSAQECGKSSIYQGGDEIVLPAQKSGAQYTSMQAAKLLGTTQQALKCANAELFAKSDSVEPIFDTLVFPNEACTGVVKNSSQAVAAKANQVSFKSGACSSEGLPERQIGRVPFNRYDYTICQYQVSVADAANSMTLASLAKDFHSPSFRFTWFNNISNPQTKLVAGQQVLIPDPDFTFWRYVGRLPFGNRDPRKLWPSLQCFKDHPELIRVLDSLYSGNFGKPSSVKSGDMFDEWTSGDAKDLTAFHIARNGVFASDTVLSALRFDIEIPGTDSLYEIKDPDICNNWLTKKIRKEIVRTEIVEVFTTEKIITQEDSTDEVDSTWGETSTYVPTIEEPDLGLRPAQRFGAWVGDDRPLPEPFENQGGQFYGIKYDLLFVHINRPNPVIWGLTGMIDSWTGKALSNYGYSGFEGSAGPLMIWCLSPSCFWGFDLQFGGRWNWGEGIGYDYDAFETNLSLSHSETFDAIWDYAHLSIWATAKLALNAQKNSHRNGQLTYQSKPVAGMDTTLYDPTSDASGIDGGFAFYFLRNISPVEPFIVYRGAYMNYDKSVSNALGVGAAFFDETVLLSGSYKIRRHSAFDNNGDAIEVVLSVNFGVGRGKPKLLK